VERIAQGEQINLLDEEDLEDLDELEEEWESEETATEAKIDPKLLREELALLRQFAALDAGHHVPDCAILAGGVHALKDKQ
jgi:Ribonuclease G/E